MWRSALNTAEIRTSLRYALNPVKACTSVSTLYYYLNTLIHCTALELVIVSYLMLMVPCSSFCHTWLNVHRSTVDCPLTSTRGLDEERWYLGLKSLSISIVGCTEALSVVWSQAMEDMMMKSWDHDHNNSTLYFENLQKLFFQRQTWPKLY